MDSTRNVQEEKNADYQWYEASGSHYEIGFTTATRAGSLLDLPHGLDCAQRRYAEQCRERTLEIYPEIGAEFAGYAKALGVTEDDLLWHYTLGAVGGCSAIAVRTPEGMIAGRNYDFFYFENRRHLIQTRPQQGYAHVGMHEGLVGGRFDGLNEKGLFVSFNGVGDYPNPPAPGMAFHLIVRYLLEKCASADEARDALSELPVKEPKSYLVADRQRAYVVEVHPERRVVRAMSDAPDATLIVTNHFIHPDMGAYAPPWPNSVARMQKLEQRIPALTRNPQNAVGTLQTILAEHEAPVCGHEDGLATFWSCSVNLAGPQLIAYSLGAPCRTPYRIYFE